MCEMHRDAEILYLRNIIDLEVAKTMIYKIIQIEQTGVDKEADAIKQNAIRKIKYTKKYYVPEKEPEFSPSLNLWLFLVVFASFGILFLIDPFTDGFMPAPSSGRIISDVFWGVILLLLAGSLYIFHLNKVEYHEKKKIEWEFHSSDYYVEKMNNPIRQINKRNLEHNRLVEQTKNQDLKKLEIIWNQRLSYYNNEIKKVENILSGLYGMNLIPNFFRPGYEYEKNCYRGIECICWIYDWMKSGPSTLSETLLNAQIEDGIRRMARRLDTIIDKIETQIQEERIVKERISTVIVQNQKMIRSLQNAESNSAIAAEYSELASNYSKANAYFSLATYLNTLNKK